MVEPENHQYPIEILRHATKNFSEGNKLGAGGFAVVYKGELENGTKVAVKRFEPVVSINNLKAFQAEIGPRIKVRHDHLVDFLGCCDEGNERILVYEYMPQGNLSKHIFDPGSRPLSWETRLSIALDVAKGMEYLHSHGSMIHRDLKPSNVLLRDYRAKVSDFDLARLVPEEEFTVVTKFAGTFGYIAPECIIGRVTTKADLYSFGVLLMVLITGKKAVDRTLDESSLVIWFKRVFWEHDNFITAIDPLLGVTNPASHSFKIIGRAARFAILCTAENADDRPGMERAVQDLSKMLSSCKDDTEASSQAEISTRSAGFAESSGPKSATFDRVEGVGASDCWEEHRFWAEANARYSEGDYDASQFRRPHNPHGRFAKFFLKKLYKVKDDTEAPSQAETSTRSAGFVESSGPKSATSDRVEGVGASDCWEELRFFRPEGDYDASQLRRPDNLITKFVIKLHKVKDEASSQAETSTRSAGFAESSSPKSATSDRVEGVGASDCWEELRFFRPEGDYDASQLRRPDNLITKFVKKLHKVKDEASSQAETSTRSAGFAESSSPKSATSDRVEGVGASDCWEELRFWAEANGRYSEDDASQVRRPNNPVTKFVKKLHKVKDEASSQAKTSTRSAGFAESSGPKSATSDRVEGVGASDCWEEHRFWAEANARYSDGDYDASQFRRPHNPHGRFAKFFLKKLYKVKDDTEAASQAETSTRSAGFAESSGPESGSFFA